MCCVFPTPSAVRRSWIHTRGSVHRSPLVVAGKGEGGLWGSPGSKLGITDWNHSHPSYEFGGRNRSVKSHPKYPARPKIPPLNSMDIQSDRRQPFFNDSNPLMSISKAKTMVRSSPFRWISEIYPLGSRCTGVGPRLIPPGGRALASGIQFSSARRRHAGTSALSLSLSLSLRSNF